ncbi:AAA family ATPase [Buttiauxella sp. A111]|uniref:AAA family ATPase n=1 Tax=Buttiauxella sp. A111 TaxID=2563088 RepID=UPI0010E11086|nr:AAA family ATPase [Buttiauxella sp. A111]GDX06669.1 hypothetical protein BSPA111_28810 [Buttiauxella sp. A111]
MAQIECMSFPIESFIMRGVYGYKTLTMNMKGRTTIFVSENGSGKTTILNALNYLLKGEYYKLHGISFDEIEVKISNRDGSFIIKKDSIKETPLEMQNIITSTLELMDDDIWDDHSIHDVLQSIKGHVTGSSIRDDSVINRLWAESSCEMNDFLERLEELKNNTDVFSFKNSVELSELSNCLSGYEVIYLPTYRRVEKSFDVENKIDSRRRGMSRRSNAKFHNQDKISFGLRDVEETLSSITLDIERQSSAGYRELSATMLDDLIRYQHKIKDAEKYVLPEIGDLARFLSRIDKPQSSNINTGPVPEKTAPLIQALRELYAKDRIKDNEYLNYFLSQLNPIIQDTKEQESKIETFVAICNKYLKSAGDSKFLTFDQSKLVVVVYDDFSGERIALNDLSSGEKQVISLMSILYLYDNNNKIILIDEPELSLSLPWQKLLLPDVDQCNTVSQVIAITHSPFIFDNQLSANATAMRVTKKL